LKTNALPFIIYLENKAVYCLQGKFRRFQAGFDPKLKTTYKDFREIFYPGLTI